MKNNKKYRMVAIFTIILILISSLPVYAEEGELTETPMVEPPPTEEVEPPPTEDIEPPPTEEVEPTPTEEVEPPPTEEVELTPTEEPQKPQVGAHQLVFTITLPEYSIKKGGDGYDRIDIESFSSSGIPGEPSLPRNVYNFALPPDVKISSLSMEVLDLQTEKLSGTYNIKPADFLPSIPGTNLLGNLVQVTEPEPHNWVSMLPYGQMRKWIFAPVEFLPFYLDNETREITVATEVTIQFNYDLKSKEVNASLLNDTVMDEVARDLFENYQAAKDWYQSESPQPSVLSVERMVIITTNAILNNSTKLFDFIDHKVQNTAYPPIWITEDQYGSLSGQAPNGRAEKIRKWLQDNYLTYNIEYVLLIGDPDPDDPSGSDTVGDVPMKMTWPRRAETTYTSYDRSPTDYFYADLSGNWDKDGDGYFGEWVGDTYAVIGGVDLTPELYVGRIPVYNDDYATLDAILQKMMDYENEVNPAWRDTVLLPMGYQADGYDGAHLAEQMRNYYLNSLGYSSWTQYNQGTGPCPADNSSYSSDQILRGGSIVQDRWSGIDYGLVIWWAHGSSTSTSVGYDGCWDGVLMNSTAASTLDDDHPSYVYLNSCNNGYPEVSNNLGYALLENGAIGTVSASRVSWFSTGVGYGDFDGSQTNSGIGYEFSERLTDFELPAGQALYNSKGALAPASQSHWLMNFFDFNLYGDPTTSIATSAPPKIVINEVDVGDPDRVELFNYGSTSVNLTGWSLKAHGGYSTTFVFPAFTLPAGSYVTLHETSGINSPAHLYFNDSIGWVGDDDGAAELLDNFGSGVDFVKWDNSPHFPPSGTGWAGPDPPASTNDGPQLGRNPSGIDTSRGLDWCEQKKSLGAKNTGCAAGDLIGMYSRSQKTWYLKDANNDGWGNVSTVRFGSTDSSWIPVEGDWNGNGTDTIGIYSRTQKTWYLKGSNTDGWGDVTTVRFGSTDSSWIPVVGDWDGNGTDTIGMYSRMQKTWYLKATNTDGWGDVTTIRFGSTDASWVPVVGDWWSMGGDFIGMYSRTQKTWYLKYLNNDGWGNVSTVRFGSTDTSWVPVVGDWNGWEDDKIGMYSPSQKTWYLKEANDDGWANVLTIRFGSTSTSWSAEVGDW